MTIMMSSSANPWEFKVSKTYFPLRDLRRLETKLAENLADIGN